MHWHRNSIGKNLSFVLLTILANVALSFLAWFDGCGSIGFGTLNLSDDLCVPYIWRFVGIEASRPAHFLLIYVFPNVVIILLWLFYLARNHSNPSPVKNSNSILVLLSFAFSLFIGTKTAQLLFDIIYGTHSF